MRKTVNVLNFCWTANGQDKKEDKKEPSSIRARRQRRERRSTGIVMDNEVSHSTANVTFLGFFFLLLSRIVLVFILKLLWHRWVLWNVCHVIDLHFEFWTARKIFYISFIRTHLDYCSTVWFGSNMKHLFSSSTCSLYSSQWKETCIFLKTQRRKKRSWRRRRIIICGNSPKIPYAASLISCYEKV